MSVFRNHYSDLSYHNIIGFTLNRIFRSPNPVNIFEKENGRGGGGNQMQGFCYILLSKSVTFIYNYFEGGNKI